MAPSNDETWSFSWGTAESAVGLLLVVGLVALSLLPLRPPPADGGDFPTAEAHALVADIARAPHPLGSAEHARVAGLIEERIRAAGLEPEVQEAVVSLSLGWGGIFRVAQVRNILARIDGNGDDAVLLVAHYDSVQTSPGAADDGAGVAALLLTLEEMAATEAPANDVIFLFSDGEEPGLLGARAFVENHPWADEVDLVMNFEARGSEGPSVMFETGPGSGALVADFAAVASHPVAASYSYDVYRFLPNDTDFSVFRDAGVPGLNFAFIGDSRHYHSRLDTADALDPRSLTHHGVHARRLARHFAAAELPAGGWGSPRTYFTLPFLGLVVHPTGLTVAAAVLALLLAGWLVLREVSGGRMAVRRLLLALAALLGALSLPALAALLVDLVVVDALGLFTEHFGDTGLFLFGQILLALGVGILTWGFFGRKLGWRPLLGAALALATLLAVALAFVLPSSAYLLAWPALAATLAALWLWRPGEAARGWKGLLLLLPALATLFLWPPALHLMSEAFGMGDGILLGLLTALALLLAAVPLAPLMAGRWGRWTGVATAVAGLLLVTVTTLGAGYGEERPEETSLLFLQDAETGDSMWATLGLPVDSWATENLGEDAEEAEVYRYLGGNAVATVAPAPALELEPPRVELRGVGQAADGPVYQLRAVSPRGAPVLRVELESESPPVSLRVAGEVLDIDPEAETTDLYLLYYSPAPQGLDLEVALTGDQPLTVIVGDQSYDLESHPGLRPRGEGRVPSRTVPTDLVVLRGGSYSFDADSAATGAAAEPPQDGEAETGDADGEERAAA